MLQQSLHRLPARCHAWPLLRRPPGPPPCAATWGRARAHATSASAAAVDTVPFEARPVPASNEAQRPQASANPQKKRARQAFDYTALAACCDELSRQWVPARVEEVVQPDQFTLALRLRTPEQQGWLHLSWQPTAARVCLGRPPRRGATSEAFSFAEQVSAALKGLVLTSVALPQPWERVAQLSFGVRPGEAPSRRVMVEVMSNYSNVVLLDEGGTITACGYQVGGRMSSVRVVQQGRPYQQPPVPPGMPPSEDIDAPTFSRHVGTAAELVAVRSGPTASANAGSEAGSSACGPAGGAEHPPRAGRSPPGAPPPQRRPTVAGGMVRAFMGCSPSLAEQLCSMACVEPGADPQQLTQQQWQDLHVQWLAWLGRIRSGRYAACLDPPSQRYSMLGCYRTACPSPNALVDEYYGDLQAGEAHTQLHQRLSSAARQALKKARGRVAAFAKQLDSSKDADGVQRQADIIMANVYRIPAGASLLEAEDWDTGEAVALPLDPATPAVEQAEGLYRRARKLRRAAAAVAPLMEAAAREVQYLEEVECSLAALALYESEQDALALAEVQEELVEAKLIKPPPAAALAAKAAAKGRKAAKRSGARGGSATSGFREFVTPSGLRVLVGRNNKQNDVLSHQVANPLDYWMHVRGIPGSHTLLRLPPGVREAAAADLQFAADLAAYFSKAKDSGKVDVVVARAEALKKPRGGKPGQVLVAKEEGNLVGRPPESAAAVAGAGGAGAAHPTR